MALIVQHKHDAYIREQLALLDEEQEKARSIEKLRRDAKQ